MLFNIALILWIIFLYFFTKKITPNTKNKKIFIVLAFLSLFITMSIRSFSTGSDTIVYTSLFDRCNSLKWDILSQNIYYEKGYLIFNILSSYIIGDARAFIVFTSFIFCLVPAVFIAKNSKQPLISIILYIELLFFYDSMTMFRQYLAMMIIVSSFIFVKKQKMLPFIVCVLLASTIHSSALIGIFLYFVYNKPFKNSRTIFILTIAIIVSFFAYPILQFFSILTNHIAAKYTDGNNIIGIFYTIFYLGSLCAVLKITKHQSNRATEGLNINPAYLNLFTVAAALSIVGIQLDVILRLVNYYSFFLIIIIPNIITELNIDKNLRKKLNATTLFCAICYSTAIIMLRPEWNTAFDYKTCLSKNEICTYEPTNQTIRKE